MHPTRVFGLLAMLSEIQGVAQVVLDFLRHGLEVFLRGRDFDVRCTLGSGWLRMASYILQLPSPGATRDRLIARILELNLEMPLAKYTKANDVLWLELQYRDEHVDADVFEKLAALQSLEDAFQRTSTVSE